MPGLVERALGRLGGAGIVSAPGVSGRRVVGAVTGTHYEDEESNVSYDEWTVPRGSGLQAGDVVVLNGARRRLKKKVDSTSMTERWILGEPEFND